MDRHGRGRPRECELSLELLAREIKKDKSQDLFPATPSLETLKLLVADCAQGQRQAKPLRIAMVDVGRASFHAPVTRSLIINTHNEKWEEGDEGDQLLRDTGTPSRTGQPHTSQVLGHDGVPGRQSVQLQLRAQDEEHQDDS